MYFKQLTRVYTKKVASTKGMSRRWVLQAFLFSNAIGTFSYDQGLTGWWQVGLSLEQAAKLAGNCLQIGRALPSTYTSTSGKIASFKQPRVLAMDWFRPQWKKKKSLLRGSEAGFKGQGWRRCPAHTGAESPPQTPKAPPRGWGPRRDILSRTDAHH